ncbi:glycosyltransferase involved in cell wall biosynthesis [Crossiella equi]|uniref:Glycosyltransferase involved in cell wall biosynthesis n=1 Tax=Crossiella equi TaxID=130796 RepID=A0ABS5AFV2_9PSEU|nr:glycosyltransferase [Crossiella equi]MBP2475453.1 glycosyltransferase involved in cell wall biosynthesis [Crossiella equi]
MSDKAARSIACTITTAAGLPAARVLARSHLEWNPGHEFVIAVLDGDRGARQAHGVRVVGWDGFGLDEDSYLRLMTAFPAAELRTALVPFLLRALLTRAELVVSLNREAKVFAPFTRLPDLTRAHGAVLLPRLLAPLPDDGRSPTEAEVLAGGVFDPSFLSVSAQAGPMLNYLCERVWQNARSGDDRWPRWTDEVAALFPHVVSRDLGAGVGHWNAGQRPVTEDVSGTLRAGGALLRFFDFAGYRPEKPWLPADLPRPRVLFSENAALHRLYETYRGELLAAGYELDTPETSRYDELPDGTPLTPLVRELFRAEWGKAVAKRQAGKDAPLPPHAFGPDKGGEFVDWLAAPGNPTQAHSGLNRWTTAIWDSRVDLRVVFPRPTEGDNEAYRQWCRSVATVEHDLATWAIPEPALERPAPTGEFGINLLGHLTAELGVGELGRALHKAVHAAGIPTATVVEDFLVNNRTAIERPDSLGAPKYPISVLCINADTTTLAVDLYPQLFSQRYRIGVWSWELEDFPPTMHKAYELVDEIWTISEFCRAAIAAHTDKPVKVFPIPISDPGPPNRGRRVPGAPVRFLFAFDFNSVGERKNPWGLVDAFRMAFPEGDEDVRLVVKAINGDLHPGAAERLRTMIGDDPRIELLERYLSVAELAALYDESDCYVSLHRSEGFGFTVAEAMARGLPVISTDYSGSAEFLDASTGYPVPFTITPVGDGWEPYPPDAVWADPDLVEAASLMRDVADDPEHAAAVGRAGREYILRTRTVSAAAHWVRSQLEQARSRLSGGTHH